MESSGRFRLSQWKQCLAAFASTLMFRPYTVNLWFLMSYTERVSVWIYLTPTLISVIYGAILAAVCSDFFGRKTAMLMTSFFLPFQIALCLFGISSVLDVRLPSSLLVILVIIEFFGRGFTNTAIPLYISEITSTNIRQSAMIFPLITVEIMLFIGVLFSFVFTSLLAYQIELSVLAFITTLLCIITLLLCPETPYYLNWRKRFEETKQSLSFYNGFKYVRTAELIAEPRNASRIIRNAREWREKLKAITDKKNISNLGMVFVLILIEWGIGQESNEIIVENMLVEQHYNYFITEGMPLSREILNSSYWSILILASIIFMSFLALVINVVPKKIFLLAVIVISFIATLIRIWITSPVIIAILLFVKFLGHFVFAGVRWSFVGVLFSTDVKAIAIAIVVSFDMLICTITSWIEYLMYQQNDEYLPWYYESPPAVKSYIDMGALVVAFFLVLIFIPKSIKVQPDETFKNYAVMRSGNLQLSDFQAAAVEPNLTL